ncbi:hypothetical protein ACIRU8_39155 [Streptomyces sp. NPDC101175]|uniref:FDXHR family putative zinc-binding protein n=1 Tax=Streptomyces sp. NPDC101175 TaxID=3366123 RepID=UPI00383731B4
MTVIQSPQLGRQAPEARNRPVGASAEPETSNSPHPTPEAATAKLRERAEAIPANAIACSCGSWWTGLSRAHCAAAGCHRTFSTDNAASKHRVGKHGIDRRCVDPATVGLIAVQKPYGTLWQNPAPEGGYTFHAATREDDPAVHEETVRAFNTAHPVGTPVIAYPSCRPEDCPDDPRLVTTTRSPAEVLGGHTPVAWVDGHDACIALTHIDPITEGATA